MTIKEKLKIRLEYIKKEQMIPATSYLLMLRDLKEQQGLIKRLLEEGKD